VVACVILTAIVWVITAGTADARPPAPYTNCTVFNKKYPHGVGKLTARDKTSGDPVTAFKRSTLLYRRAMRYNAGLDRDKDGIACEKA
jgi:Excalibur calcium-binding domain